MDMVLVKKSFWVDGLSIIKKLAKLLNASGEKTASMAHYVMQVQNFNETRNYAFPTILTDGIELKVAFEDFIGVFTSKKRNVN